MAARETHLQWLRAQEEDMQSMACLSKHEPGREVCITSPSGVDWQANILLSWNDSLLGNKSTQLGIICLLFLFKLSLSEQDPKLRQSPLGFSIDCFKMRCFTFVSQQEVEIVLFLIALDNKTDFHFAVNACVHMALAGSSCADCAGRVCCLALFCGQLTRMRLINILSQSVQSTYAAKRTFDYSVYHTNIAFGIVSHFRGWRLEIQ